MKKICAFFLIVVMLMTLLPANRAMAAESEKKPFYFVNISGSATEKGSEYLYSMPFFWSRVPTPETEWPHVSWDGVADIGQLAQNLKAEFDARPEGTRYINYSLLPDALKGLVENAIYMEKGVELNQLWLDTFLAEYKRIGGKIDGIIVDLEYNYVLSFYIAQVYTGTTGAYPKNENIHNDIVNDSRYATTVRPLLEEWGFQFYENAGGEKSEIFCISNGLTAGEKGKHADCSGIWDAVMEYRLGQYITQAVYEPLTKYYPNGIVSDYKRADLNAWDKPVGERGGITLYNQYKAGNASNYNMYGDLPSWPFYLDSNDNPIYTKNPVSFRDALYDRGGYGMTLWYANNFKSMYNATDTGKVNAWISEFAYNAHYNPNPDLTNCDTPYYTETLFHLGMLDPEPFLGYIVENKVDPDAGYETCLQVVAEIMEELTKVAGYADRKPISVPVTWNGDFILSGMYAGGRNIWRITPNTASGTSLEAFKVAGEDPTFSIDGQTITFPGGKIIEDGYVSKVGTCGYWVETAADVTPVVTSSANRYQENPSFEENFEKYVENAVFNSQTALPQRCWNVSGSLSVQAQGNGKALAMNGTASAANVNMPKNIVSGDYYAKQQAWEITVTLPEGLASNAEVKLLDIGDGGIKISGGKVYCAGASGYQELSGVSLSAGTYTVKRDVDFRTEGAFKSSYSISDASGNLLGQLKDVAIAAISLPVASISLSCANVDKTVFVDDYKLYPIGITTDFEVYDVAHGAKLTVGETRTTDTAYRLSWMNAAADKMICYVYNEIDGKIIQKVEMAAGKDAVVTGEVKVAAGEQLKLAIKTVLASASVAPDTQNPDGGNNNSSNDNGGTDTEEPDNIQDVTGEEVNPPSQPAEKPADPVDPTPQKKGLGGGVIALIVLDALIAVAVVLYFTLVRGKEAQLLEKLKKIFKR